LFGPFHWPFRGDPANSHAEISKSKLPGAAHKAEGSPFPKGTRHGCEIHISAHEDVRNIVASIQTLFISPNEMEIQSLAIQQHSQS
jgi:hypothetical protein